MVAISSVATVDSIYLRLRERILNAALMPGASMLEHELAQELHATPTDLREAATLLEQEGLIQQARGRITVTPIHLEHVVSISRQLSVLESRAAYIAAIKGPTPIGLSALSDAVLTMQDAIYRGDSIRWARAAHHFHRSLVQCSARPRLIASALTLSEPMHRTRMICVKLSGPTPDSAEAAGTLVEAIRMGEAGEAYDLHLHWWRRTTDAFLNLVRRNGIPELEGSPAVSGF